MVQVNTGDIVRTDLIGEWNADTQIVQSYQFKMELGGPIEDFEALDDLADIVEELFDLVQWLWNGLMIFRRIRARLVPSGLIIGDYNYTPPLAGVTASEVSSTTVTAPVSFHTSWPRVVLRKSLGPILENGIWTDGRLTGASVGFMTSYATRMLLPFTKTYGTWSYGHYSPVALGWVYPTGAVVSNIPGTMARRRLGRGV